jgi:hypothetical protein
MRAGDSTGEAVEVSFPKLRNPVLRHGWLWIDTGGEAESFVVEIPRLAVRDIGTRFGVRVREDWTAEVHVIDGSVEIRGKGPTGFGIMLLRVGMPPRWRCSWTDAGWRWTTSFVLPATGCFPAGTSASARRVPRGLRCVSP